MKHQWRLLTGLFAVGLLLTTAVGVANASKAADPYQLMIIVPLTAAAGNQTNTIIGAKAAAQAINQQKGVGGRQLEIIPCDTVNTLTGSQACARKAIEQKVDSVFEINSFDLQARAILTPAGIPDIGGLALGATADKLMFPVSPSGPVANGGMAAWFVKYGGCKRFMTVSADLLVTRQNTQLARIASERLKKGSFVGAVWFPLFTADYATVAQQIKQLNPDCILAQNSEVGNIQLAKTLVQFGVPINDGVKFATPSPFSSQANADSMPNKGVGTYILGQLPIPDLDSNLSYQKLYRTQLVAAGTSADSADIRNPTTFNGWLFTWSVKKLADTIKGPVTTASMIAAAKKGKNIDLLGAMKWSPGLKGPAAYPSVNNGQMFVGRWDGTKFAPAQPYPLNFYKLIGYQK